MSAKNRVIESIEDDVYPTPPWVVHRLLEAISLPRDGVWLEPACGHGAIIEAIGARDWRGCDLVTTGEDYLQRAPEPVRVAITNPPFKRAFEFAKKMRSEAEHALILARLNLLGSGHRTGRLDWFRADTPNVYVLPNRPTFAHQVSCGARRHGGLIPWNAPLTDTYDCPTCGAPAKRRAGNDATEYAWFHWGPDAGGSLRILASTPKTERVDRRTR